MVTKNTDGRITAVNSGKAFSANSNYLVFNVTPTDATIVVDGLQYKLEADGSLTLFVSCDLHKYEVSAEGYTTEYGEISVGQQRAKVIINLRKK